MLQDILQMVEDEAFPRLLEPPLTEEHWGFGKRQEETGICW